MSARWSSAKLQADPLDVIAGTDRASTAIGPCRVSSAAQPLAGSSATQAVQPADSLGPPARTAPRAGRTAPQAGQNVIGCHRATRCRTSRGQDDGDCVVLSGLAARGLGVNEDQGGGFAGTSRTNSHPPPAAGPATGRARGSLPRTAGSPTAAKPADGRASSLFAKRADIDQGLVTASSTRLC